MEDYRYFLHSPSLGALARAELRMTAWHAAGNLDSQKRFKTTEEQQVLSLLHTQDIHTNNKYI